MKLKVGETYGICINKQTYAEKILRVVPLWEGKIDKVYVVVCKRETVYNAEKHCLVKFVGGQGDGFTITHILKDEVWYSIDYTSLQDDLTWV